MISFLLKGIIRDRSRSMLPIIIVAIGVMLTVAMAGYMRGVLGDVIKQTAIFDTGHVKIFHEAYAKNMGRFPLAYRIDDADSIVEKMQKDWPEMDWTKRMKLTAMVESKSSEGQVKGRGPALIMAYELLDSNPQEVKRLGLEKALRTGDLPSQPKDILISQVFAENLGVSPKDDLPILITPENGRLKIDTFRVAGLISFGLPQMDQGVIIMDQDMASEVSGIAGSTTEILGFLPTQKYDAEKVNNIAAQFNNRQEGDVIMKTMEKQGDLESILQLSRAMGALLIFVFIIAMSIVLWNTGLIAGLRRYKEFGIRLAMGESKKSIYLSFAFEAIIIGIIGTIIGTFFGALFIWYLQEYGIDISAMLDDADMGLMIPTRLSAQLTPDLFFIGFIPGVIAMVLGNLLSGIAIYKRDTASLMREMET